MKDSFAKTIGDTFDIPRGIPAARFSFISSTAHSFGMMAGTHDTCPTTTTCFGESIGITIGHLLSSFVLQEEVVV